MAETRKKFDPVRAAAVEVLGLVEAGKHTSEEAVTQIIAGREFSPLDIRFLRQLVNGGIKLKRRLDHDMRFFLSKPSEKMPRRMVDILRLGFYQLFFMERIPHAAAVSESVNLTRYFCDEPRAKVVNAVLRAAIRNPERVAFRDKKEEPMRHLADFYSYPEWFVEYCLNEFKMEETEKLLKSMNEPPQITFRVNLLKAKPEEVATYLQKSGIKYHTGKYLSEFFHVEDGAFPMDNELIKTGKIYIQDESAGMAVRLMNPKMGMSVLDMAAAPGGKATYAAVKMRNKGMVTAVDRSHARLEIMMENSRRMGIKIINPVAADVLEFNAEPFDRVLLDAPCSGWGNAGKHSDLRWTKELKDVERLFKVQSMMIDKAAKLVKPGGILIYSTCTIIRHENDQVVEEFLARRKDFALESAEEYFDREIVSERGFLKTYPNKGDLSGAFAARLKKVLDTKKEK
ncbi:putative Ribosomal RNA small subunit methyltransferase B [Candidatus Zixiibacteriota bacterium]|nr:putative Ribosomal RNA small subunit methyltransferase B [candidate division Zixibacteria bacterium]